MTFLYFSVLLASGIATFYFLIYYQQLESKPTLKNVLKNIRSIRIGEKELDTMNEGDVEAIIIKQLGKKFANIQSQVMIEFSKRSRQKIDIDIGGGSIGIEVKLARTLKNINERNRLVGQVLFYREQKYNRHNLLVLVVGSKEQEEHESIRALRQMICKDGNNFFYLKAV